MCPLCDRLQLSSEPTQEDSEADKDKRLCKLITSLTTAHVVRLPHL